MTRVLIIEDDEAIRRLVVGALQQEGYEVSVALDGAEGLEAFARARPDVVVLDLRLPDIHGFEVCHRIRQQSASPILMLTAMSEEEEVVRGFQIGADDYLTKPFSVRVLLARVEALVRRSGTRLNLGDRAIEVADLVVDLDRVQVRIRGRPIELTPTEFRLISYLARNAGQVLKSSQLLLQIQDAPMSNRDAQEIIKVHIRHLRNKVERDPAEPQYIRTVRGFGYVLDGPVHESLTRR
jgi:two-component system, OmpR family, alkaline phosphatase synthesis response regulator PhoP